MCMIGEPASRNLFHLKPEVQCDAELHFSGDNDNGGCGDEDDDDDVDEEEEGGTRKSVAFPRVTDNQKVSRCSAAGNRSVFTGQLAPDPLFNPWCSRQFVFTVKVHLHQQLSSDHKWPCNLHFKVIYLLAEPTAGKTKNIPLYLKRSVVSAIDSELKECSRNSGAEDFKMSLNLSWAHSLPFSLWPLKWAPASRWRITHNPYPLPFVRHSSLLFL